RTPTSQPRPQLMASPKSIRVGAQGTLLDAHPRAFARLGAIGAAYHGAPRRESRLLGETPVESRAAPASRREHCSTAPHVQGSWVVLWWTSPPRTFGSSVSIPHPIVCAIMRSPNTSTR